jgi:hypothetical protein
MGKCNNYNINTLRWVKNWYVSIEIRIEIIGFLVRKLDGAARLERKVV